MAASVTVSELLFRNVSSGYTRVRSQCAYRHRNAAIRRISVDRRVAKLAEYLVYNERPEQLEKIADFANGENPAIFAHHVLPL